MMGNVTRPRIVGPVALVVILGLFLSPAPVTARVNSCFPPCRDGYICSPDGQCVSACNPPCGSGELCRAGKCVPRADLEKVAAEASYESLHSFALTAGGVVQNASGKFKGTAGGVALSFSYVLGRMHGLLIEPRFMVLFGNGASMPEVGLNLGYQLKLGSGSLKGGVRAGLATNLWINTSNDIRDPVFFYIGGLIGGFLQYNRFYVQIPVDVGALPFFSPLAYSLTVAFLVGFTF